MAKKSPPAPDRLQWFRDARFGMFIHWGLYAIPARGEWVRNAERISNEAYQPYFDEFNPTRYDPRTWARLAKAAGQKYVVLTAKHHEGFCLFDSKLTDYKSTNTPAKRDLVKEYVAAFRAEGLKVGFYYSLLDWHHPHYPAYGDHIHPMRDNEDYKNQKRDLSKYVDYLHGQVKELLTNYGRIDLLWFDFSYDSPRLNLQMAGETWRANDLVKMIRKLQPHIILNNRLSLGHEAIGGSTAHGDLATPEQIIPPQGVTQADGSPALWEACITMNDHWGYDHHDHHFKTPAQLVHMLVECVSKSGNLLLNVGPTIKGEIQPEFQRDLTAIGDWMNRNSASIYGCSRAPSVPKPDWGRYTLSNDGKILYAHLFEKPIGPLAIANMAGKVTHARYLADGAEVRIYQPWNARGNTTDLFLDLPGTTLPDPLDTVIALYLT